MARVCARRAAGIVVGEYFRRSGLPDPGASAYDRLRLLAEFPGLPQEVGQIAGHFTVHIDTEHRLPVDADLISEARWLAQTLLGYAQPSK